ncbi:hypothetical protein AAMO2058_000970600 [Amorphochlora amoebiformis]
MMNVSNAVLRHGKGLEEDLNQCSLKFKFILTSRLELGSGSDIHIKGLERQTREEGFDYGKIDLRKCCPAPEILSQEAAEGEESGRSHRGRHGC